MFKWLGRLLFGKRNNVDDDIVVVAPKRPYRGTLQTDNEGNNMPMLVEQQDHVDTQMIMIDDGNGNMVQATPQQMQAMMYRPDNFEGIAPGQIPRKQRPPQQMQQRPMQQPQRQYPQQQPQQPPPEWNQWQQPQGYPPQQNYPQQGYPQQQQQPPPQQPFTPTQMPRKPYPIYEQYTVDNEYHLEIDLPGIDEGSLTMEYADSILVVGGYREAATEKLKRIKNKKTDMTVSDSTSYIPQHLLGKFTFDFPFKKLIDESAILAEYNGGVLHITLPHRVKGDKISIGLKKPTKSNDRTD